MRSIDIVRNNPEVTFPDNVNYDFIYWKHTPDNIDSAIDAVADCDIVAIELASFDALSTQDSSRAATAQRFELYLNAVLQGHANRQVIDWVKNLDEETPDAATRIALRYAGSGKLLTFIDAWEHSDDPTHITQRDDLFPSLWAGPEEISEKIQIFATVLRERETIALNQLAEIGQKHAPQTTEDPITIGVLYGAKHSLLSIAMHDLGAQVQRRFISGTLYKSPDSTLIDTIRTRETVDETTLTVMSSNICLARMAMTTYMDLREDANSRILKGFSPTAASAVRLDSILAHTLGKNTPEGEALRDTLFDTFAPSKPHRLFESRRRKHKEAKFLAVMKRYEQLAAALSEH